MHHAICIIRDVLANTHLWKLDFDWFTGCGTVRHKPVSGRTSSTQAMSVTDEGQAPAH